MTIIKKIKLRVIISCFSFFLVYYSVAFSLLTFNSNEKKHNKIRSKIVEKNEKFRGDIYDKNGYLIATSIRKYDLIINPSILRFPKKFYIKAEKIFGHKINDDLKKKIISNLKYLKLKKNISKIQYQRILKIGEPGIEIEENYLRKYPGKTLASHIIGKVDVDGNGVSGIELKLNKHLSNSHDIHLSIDSGIQSILKRLLFEQINRFKAKGGSGILMNANNGKIISIVSLPDFDNNINNNLTEEQIFNNATKGVYELGSTLKIFTVAMAIESGKFKDNDLIDVSSPIPLSKFQKIKDIKTIKFPINLPEIIVHSSNIGTAKIANLLGHNIQKKFFNLIGFNKKINIEIVETSLPSVNSEKHISSLMSKSYGYGIQISPLHLAKATAIVLNGGMEIQPTLLKSKIKYNNNNQIFSPETSRKIRSMLYLVVNDKNGTGKLAKSFDYSIGGKTGTVKKFINGKYSNTENIVAFTGAFPIDNPKYVFTLVIDSPKPQKFSAYRNTAGWVVAPLAGKLINRVAPILKIKPQSLHPSGLSLKHYKIRGTTL